ncbi:MAG TPA: glycosyltransferase family A protein [Candidatus Peribacteraceae bacterium]|nr:glycosyltransferase family A protein [Candidatus Peribacteraceae bacterium]
MAQTNADVAVIVPTYNRSAILTETLDSVAAQTWPPAYLIVVDDGSTDETQVVLEKWQTRPLPFPVKIIRQENQGAGIARNAGLHAAPPVRYVAFLDSDDLWPPDFLERTVTLLESNQDAVAAVCKAEYVYQRTFRQEARRQLRLLLTRCGVKRLLEPWLRKRLHRSHEYLPCNPLAWFFRNAVGVNSCTLVRRADALVMGGFDESFLSNEDAPFYLSLSLCGRWIFSPGQPVVIRTDVGRRPDVETNLSEKYDDGGRQWAQAFENFLAHHDVSSHITVKDVNRAMSRKWNIAGNQLRNHRHGNEAAACYRKAFSYNPKNIAVRWNLLINRL